MSQLSAQHVRELDPCAFLAVLGKRVIHPGGRECTEWLLDWAAVQPGERVLDIGCGVGTTAIRIARETGAEVVAIDFSSLMREHTVRNVARSGIDRVRVEAADILELPYEDNSFDCVVAEAVTMFVDRMRAAKELARVCKPGGRVLATEFCWRRPPTDEMLELFLGQVSPGMQSDTFEEWMHIYAGASLIDVKTARGPFALMTARGFLSDEGSNALAVIVRLMTRPTYLRKMAWLMPRMARAVPHLGYIVLSARKPSLSARPEPAGLTGH
jgi:cyclopropane fatty-acyl-phospholipid synthase-like methyltransferase